MSDDTIDNYKIGEKNDGTIIFKKDFYEWKKGDFPILTGYLSDLKISVKKAIDEGKLIIEAEEQIEKNISLIDKIKQLRPTMKDFTPIKNH